MLEIHNEPKNMDEKQLNQNKKLTKIVIIIHILNYSIHPTEQKPHMHILTIWGKAYI